MTYELALRLKEAGFPILIINKYGNRANEIDSSFYPIPDGHGDFWKLPSLSELIESIPKHRCFILKRVEDNWEAVTEKSLSIGQPLKYKTPEEAVANLYLVLKK